MPLTYIKIASVTVGSGGSSAITFSSIPSLYTDLILKLSGRTTYSGGGTALLWVRFNSATTNYSMRKLQGNGSGASSDYFTAPAQLEMAFIPGTTYTASTFNNVEIYIPNYAGSTNKSVSVDAVTENNATLSWASMYADLWSNSAAISTIELYPETATGIWAEFSTATLYGISKS